MNDLLLAAAYFFPFFHVVLSEAATVQPDYKWTKIMPIRVNTVFDQGQQYTNLAPFQITKTNSTDSMEIKALQIRPEFMLHKKLTEKMLAFQKLITELNKKNIPDAMADTFNRDIEEINQFAGLGNDRLRLVKKKQAKLVTMLEKELKLVTINHYTNQWLALGLSIFGIPIGIAIGLNKGNMGLLGLGLPIGMLIGIVVGASMDKKAKEAGKQLAVELK